METNKRPPGSGVRYEAFLGRRNSDTEVSFQGRIQNMGKCIKISNEKAQKLGIVEVKKKLCVSTELLF